MPVAVSRKLEYFVHRYGLDVDVRVFPVVLTLDQVRSYQLPRTPIKETERRRLGFESRHGEGAVELDALEALYPGELADLLSGYIEAYYDTSLGERVEAFEQELAYRLEGIQQHVLGGFAPDIERVRQEYKQVRAEYAQRMQGCSERLSSLWNTIKSELALSAPRIDMEAFPQAVWAEEIGEGLYDSTRDYMEQLETYKAFQGK
jgi:hypothetical protein